MLDQALAAAQQLKLLLSTAHGDAEVQATMMQRGAFETGITDIRSNSTHPASQTALVL